MNILPPDMLPPGFGPVLHEQQAAPRSLRHEENVNRQVQLCLFLRSTGQPWAEAMLSLRDCCIGLEDQAFLDAWAKWPCHARLVDGVVVYEPTNEDAASGFQLIMGLLSRWGMTFKTRTISKTPALPTHTPNPLLQTPLDDEDPTATPQAQA